MALKDYLISRAEPHEESFGCPGNLPKLMEAGERLRGFQFSVKQRDEFRYDVVL